MKKTLYFLMLLCLFVITAGFRGCKTETQELLDYSYIQIASGRWVFTPGDDIYNLFSIAVGHNGKIVSSDGRPDAQWIERQSGVTQNLNAVAVPQNTDSAVAYAVGDQGVILRTSDRGHNWSIIKTPNQNQANLNGVGVVPPLGPGFIKMIAVGNSGTVLKSSNSGGSWSWINVSINTTKKLNSVAAVNDQLFTVVGDSGAIYRTLDGGANWENRSISTSVSLKKITSISYDRYCAVGTNGSIYKSSDYGYSWSLRNSGTTKTFRDVYFSGIDSGSCAGDSGTVRLTTNGGLSWFSDTFLSGTTTKNIISFARADGNTFNSIITNNNPGDNLVDTTFFLAVSSEPFLGIEPISNLVSAMFGLKQNYPNPFNPVTKIRFSLPNLSKGGAQTVTLIIYNVQGREVASLIPPLRGGQEGLGPGTYETVWNASAYPSGVYFYKLTADDYSETKKMILLK